MTAFSAVTFLNLTAGFDGIFEECRRFCRHLLKILHIFATDNLPYEKVGKNEPVCIADEVPFEIPENCE